jgi:membrane protease YdiL (CAAX protease family)
LKDGAKLAAYFGATILLGAFLAPPLFWAARSLAAHGLVPFLEQYGFATVFHRAVLIAAALLLWPFLRITKVRRATDLGLAPNPRWGCDLLAGVLLAAIPLLCCGALLITLNVYSLRHNLLWTRFCMVLAAAVSVPLIEEPFFRGIILGVLLRTGRMRMAIFVVSALFAAIHFLKAPERTSTVVTWSSGFKSIVHSFVVMGQPMLLASAFITLLVIGCILAVARVVTCSLWLPIGLHAGWIFGSGTFNWLARRQTVVLPWLGKNLFIGIVPLGVAALTWIMMRIWLKYDRAAQP